MIVVVVVVVVIVVVQFTKEIHTPYITSRMRNDVGRTTYVAFVVYIIYSAVHIYIHMYVYIKVA